MSRKRPDGMDCPAGFVWAVALTLALFLSGCGATNDEANFAHIPASDFHDILVARESILLDIRTPQEFAAARIPGAVMIDFNSLSFRSRIEALEKDKIYLIYCRTGTRTQKSMRLYQQLGFATVLGLQGGIEAWARYGYPVSR